jgi:hypothetical protein
MLADGSSQHRISRLQRIQNCPLGDWARDVQGYLTPNMRQCSQMKWEYYPNHDRSQTLKSRLSRRRIVGLLQVGDDDFSHLQHGLEDRM